MKDYFYTLSNYIQLILQPHEMFLGNIIGESSDFVRINQSNVRQNGHVDQCYLNITLIKENKKAEHTIGLSANSEDDKGQIKRTIQLLRDRIDYLPVDPYLLISEDVHSTEDINKNTLSPVEQVIPEILDRSKGSDLVGIFASGPVYQGFSNSFGQRNWYENSNFNFDWCIYHEGDKAVKCNYAGFEWEYSTFASKMDQAVREMEVTKRTPMTIKPGKYKAFLSPSALESIMDLFNRKAFGIRTNKTKNSCLNRMIIDGVALDPAVTMIENTQEGIACRFQSEGFIKPDAITLIEKGKRKDSLVCSRSAKEYGVDCNGADSSESPKSFELLPGTLKQGDVVNTLDTGVYLKRLHYLNFSDLNACRITGLTKYGCFWVEKGEIQAPINVMRFDETVFNVLGEQLLALTQEREFLSSSDSFFKRCAESQHLPGVLVKDFRFTM